MVTAPTHHYQWYRDAHLSSMRSESLLLIRTPLTADCIIHHVCDEAWNDWFLWYRSTPGSIFKLALFTVMLSNLFLPPINQKDWTLTLLRSLFLILYIWTRRCCTSIYVLGTELYVSLSHAPDLPFTFQMIIDQWMFNTQNKWFDFIQFHISIC